MSAADTGRVLDGHSRVVCSNYSASADGAQAGFCWKCGWHHDAHNAIAIEREMNRAPSGRFGHGDMAPCRCGHPRGAHTATGQAGMVDDIDDAQAARFGVAATGEHCDCAGFRGVAA